MQTPDSLRYTKEHEWAVADAGRVRIGITDFAQDALGDVVYVQLPEMGDHVVAGESFGEVESTKSVSDLYSPCSGVVVEVNVTLEDQPELVNSDPYGEGWMLLVEPDSGVDAGSVVAPLMDAATYRAWCESEG